MLMGSTMTLMPSLLEHLVAVRDLVEDHAVLEAGAAAALDVDAQAAPGHGLLLLLQDPLDLRQGIVRNLNHFD